jgi:hypothetical protein
MGKDSYSINSEEQKIIQILGENEDTHGSNSCVYASELESKAGRIIKDPRTVLENLCNHNLVKLHLPDKLPTKHILSQLPAYINERTGISEHQRGCRYSLTSEGHELYKQLSNPK